MAALSRSEIIDLISRIDYHGARSKAAANRTAERIAEALYSRNLLHPDVAFYPEWRGVELAPTTVVRIKDPAWGEHVGVVTAADRDMIHVQGPQIDDVRVMSWAIHVGVLDDHLLEARSLDGQRVGRVGGEG